MKFFYKSFLAAFIFLLIANSAGYAQSFDYTEKPARKFNYIETTVNVTLNTKQTAVKGSVTYLLKSSNTTADSLVLYAPEIAVDSVISMNQPLKYTITNDRLNIALNDSAFTQKQFQVKIYYHSDPRFGLLKDSEGTIWTSLLPQSHRHWLPSPDHPGVETITTLTLTVPASSSVAATGVKTDEEVLGLDSKRVTYRSSHAIPITSLAFAVGKLNTEGSSFGIKRIITYAEPGTADRSLQNKLANTTKQIISEIEAAAQMEYPYQHLHVVILNDHFWEQKPYGASVIYLYKNRGDLLNQLRRGLYAQWFGVYQHEAQWANAWPVQLFQSALHYKIANEPIYLKNEASPEINFQTVYEAYSVNRWNFWQQMPQWKKQTQQIASQIIPEVLLRGSGTFTEQRYQNLWYRLSGEPIIDIPAAQIDSVSLIDSASVYRVDIQTVGDSLKVAFSAKGKPVNQPESILVKVIGGGSVSTHEVTVSGAKYSAIIPTSVMVQNVILENKSNDLELKIHKPVPFILYQLDHAESEEVRKRAALQLGYHTENPDIQLVITGYLKKETEPEVKAALLRSYAAITNGASGTQQYFVKALDSPNAEIRQAALAGIQNYPKDAQITQKVRNIIEQSDSLNEDFLKIYMQRIDSTKALGFVNSLVQQDTAGTKAIQAIAALGASGKTEPAVKLAKYYIQPVYAYPVRKKALSVLLKYDDSVQQWQKRIEMLLTDLDPRIRYLTIQNLSNIQGIKKGEVLQKYMPVTYDARIFYSIE